MEKDFEDNVADVNLGRVDLQQWITRLTQKIFKFNALNQ